MAESASMSPSAEAEAVAKASGAGTVAAPVKTSMLERFLALRELRVTEKPARRGRSKAKKPPEDDKPKKPDNTLLWRTYSKRHHGERVAALRAALRRPDDGLGDSVDAYVPRKRPQRLLDMHGEEQEVSEAFHTATRALFYEREVLDRPVCDREENRFEFEVRLWGLVGVDISTDQGEIDGSHDDENAGPRIEFVESSRQQQQESANAAGIFEL